jgi:hypothetical protein
VGEEVTYTYDVFMSLPGVVFGVYDDKLGGIGQTSGERLTRTTTLTQTTTNTASVSLIQGDCYCVGYHDDSVTVTVIQPDCLCVPIQVVPQGNLVALKNVSTGGKGSKLTRTVSVKLEAREVSPGSCPAGEISEPTSVTLRIVDDDGDVVIDRTKNSFVCESGKQTHMKFGVRYEGPENCAGSVAPTRQVSKGDLFVIASTADGSLDDTLRIQCKR